jgi:hypothetical protein
MSYVSSHLNLFRGYSFHQPHGNGHYLGFTKYINRHLWDFRDLCIPYKTIWQTTGETWHPVELLYTPDETIRNTITQHYFATGEIILFGSSRRIFILKDDEVNYIGKFTRGKLLETLYEIVE